MDNLVIKKVIDKLDEILFPSLLEGNFPFNKKVVKKRGLIETYLKFHVFQNKILTKFNYNELCNYEGVIIGHTGKIHQRKDRSIGDYSNLFLKRYLNENEINTLGLLIPSLKEIFLFQHFLKNSLLKKNDSCILPHFTSQKGVLQSVDKERIKSNLKDKIFLLQDKSQEEKYPSENLEYVNKNLNLYRDFVTSPAFLNYFSGMILGIQKVFQQTKPQFVIVNSVVGFKDRLALFIAKENNLETILIPHGLGEKPLNEDFISPDIFVSQDYEPDKPENDEREVNTWNLGLLNFGYLLSNDNKKRKTSEKKTLVYATQPFAKDGQLPEKKYKDFLASLFSEFKNIVGKNEIRLVLKLHPRDDISFYRRILNKTNLHGVEFIEEPSPISIERIKKLDPDLVLTARSTFGVEMVILGVPLLSIIPTGLEDKPSLSSREISFPAPIYASSNLDKLGEKISQILQNRQFANLLLEKEQRGFKDKDAWVEEKSLRLFIKRLANHLKNNKLS